EVVEDESFTPEVRCQDHGGGSRDGLSPGECGMSGPCRPRSWTLIPPSRDVDRPGTRADRTTPAAPSPSEFLPITGIECPEQPVPDQCVEAKVDATVSMMLGVKRARSKIPKDTPAGPAARQWLDPQMSHRAEDHVQDQVHHDPEPGGAVEGDDHQ